MADTLVTVFSAKVYAATAQIPKGKVATYGQIARLAGSARAARAVGQLMARNKDPKTVPCHRVVGANGALTGYAFNGVSMKRKKLIEEGVSLKGSRVDLAKSLWNH
ncbi:MAG: MGMT family protein [Minisyncoccota bacterium]